MYDGPNELSACLMACLTSHQTNMTVTCMQAVLAQQVHTVLEDSQAICAIHTLGFTAEHDAVMLNSLTDAGTAQGTFQYLQNSQVGCLEICVQADDRLNH